MAMNMDAVLKIRADVQGASNIRALSGGFQGLAQAAQLSTADLGKLNIQINRQARETGNTIVGMKAYATALGQLRDRVEIGSKAWSRLGVEIEGVKARMAAANAVQEATPRIVGRNLNAIQQQITRLQQLRQEVEIGSKKFELYTAGIGRLQAKMATAAGGAGSGGFRGVAGNAAGSLAMGGGFQGALGGAAGAAAAGGTAAGLALAGGVVAGGAFIAASTSNALNEEASIRRIRTLSDDSENLMMKIRQLTTEQGNLSSSADAGAAAYEILSSGFSKTADVLAILKASTYGATGGFSDIKTVADAATSIMNSFGLSADKVTRVVDQMVQTQNDGKIVVDQYAQSVGRLAPTFAVAGLSVEEMNAAISALTSKGAPVETTMSGLNQTIKSIIKPTEEAKKVAAALGLEFSAAALQAKGLGGFLQDVTDKTKGNVTALGVLFSDIDGFKAVASLTNDGLKAYNKSLGNMERQTNQAARASALAVDPIKQFDNSWKDFSATAGQLVVPALTGMLQGLTGILNALKSTDWAKLGALVQAQDGGATAGQFTPEQIRALAGAEARRAAPGNWNNMPWPEGIPRPGTIPAQPRMSAQRKPEDTAITGLVNGVVGAGAGAGAGKEPDAFKLSSQGKALVAAAQKLGVSPLDLAQLISFETIGTFSSAIWGGTGNNYLGLIQLGAPERKQYGANPRQSFEEQVQGPVVGFLQDRARLRGLSTQGMSAAEMYRLVNPGYGDAAFNRDSGARGDRNNALRRFFGGKAENVGYDAAVAGADAAQGREAAQKEAEQTANQLTAAVDLLRTKEAAFEIVNAITPLEKLSLEFDNERTKRMQEYVNKLSGAKSDEERLLLVQSQALDIRGAEIDAQEKMKAITGEQLDLERERASLLADSMARMEEMSTRSSIGAGAQQGIQSYVDSLGNLRDAVGQLTTNAIGGLENSLTELATTGTANFREFATSILKDTSRMIIRQLVLKTIMQIIGGIGGSATAKSFEMPGAAFIPSGGYAFANGGAFANGIQPFAMSGIVNNPTLFKFAKGGSFNTGLMSEAGPEAIMPLRRGRDGRLGVAGGGGGDTTINVSVDAKGTNVQGDSGQGAALARAVSQAVQTEMVKQRRPGGILAS